MKRVMMMGRVSCGKTTLCQYLLGQELRYHKTQTVQILGDAIDTPGETPSIPPGSMWKTAP